MVTLKELQVSQKNRFGYFNTKRRVQLGNVLFRSGRAVRILSIDGIEIPKVVKVRPSLSRK